MAAAAGAHQAYFHHPGWPFFIWFQKLAAALKDKQIISADDLAQSLQEASNSLNISAHLAYLDETNIATVTERAAEAAMQAVKPTSDIYTVLDETFEETKRILTYYQPALEEQVQTFLLSKGYNPNKFRPIQRIRIALAIRDESFVRIDGTLRVVSTCLPVKLFLEGMLLYVQGEIVPEDLQGKIQQVKTWRARASELDKIKKRDIHKWMYEAVVILENLVHAETDKPQIHNLAESIRDSIHAKYEKVDVVVLGNIKALNYELLEVYAPESLSLIEEIYQALEKDIGNGKQE